MEAREEPGELEAAPETGGMTIAVFKAGVFAFLYLEVLDASFSFDGVIGAFAISNDVLVIALGLGIGAFWIRSLTIYLVRAGTLSEYVYLEHGAHWAIGVLAVIMLASVEYHIPEVRHRPHRRRVHPRRAAQLAGRAQAPPAEVDVDGRRRGTGRRRRSSRSGRRQASGPTAKIAEPASVRGRRCSRRRCRTTRPATAAAGPGVSP